MEKNTKFFANLEKKKFEQKTVSKLIINNVTVTDPKAILHETKDYYQNIYKKTVLQNTFNNFVDFEVEKINDVQRNSCEGKLTEIECATALKQIQNNKSPGSDGLTAEFYKIFWNEIKHYYIASINSSYDTGNLTQMQKQGIINLIPKKGKDTTSLNNWRPISL